MVMLLEKMLQSQGFGSRKYCQQLIKQGAIKIQGQIQHDLKLNVNVQDLNFSVYNQDFIYREKVYLALNKPKNYECSHQATHHFSVFDLFDPILIQRGLQCVGRLDQDTTGLLLLTDDGQFLQALTHPKKHVAKVYQMMTADPITEQQIQALQQGVALKNETGLFCATQIQQLAENQLQFAIHQGVYHQVKRMLAAVGNKVVQLHRLQIGELILPELAEGQWIYLTESQVQQAKVRHL